MVKSLELFKGILFFSYIIFVAVSHLFLLVGGASFLLLRREVEYVKGTITKRVAYEREMAHI